MSGPINTQPGSPNSLSPPTGYRVNHITFGVIALAVAALLAVFIIFIVAPYFKHLFTISTQPQMVNYLKIASHWIGGTACGLILKGLWEDFKRMFG